MSIYFDVTKDVSETGPLLFTILFGSEFVRIGGEIFKNVNQVQSPALFIIVIVIATQFENHRQCLSSW